METMPNKQPSQSQASDTKLTQKESHTVLYVALIAALTVAAVFVGTYVLLQSQFDETLDYGLADWFKIALPIAGSALVAIFAFLGVDRLKNFDERQDKLAAELRSDIKERINDAIQGIGPRLDEKVHDFDAAVQNKYRAATERFQNMDGKVSATQEDISQMKKEVIELSKTVQDRLDWFKDAMGTVGDAEAIVKGVGNVREAHDVITKLSSEQLEKAQCVTIIGAIVKRVTESSITGDSDDYHNLSSALARQDYFDLAADVAKAGLSIFRDNIDLLSDFIHFSHKVGRYADATAAVEQLDNIERTLWNWRAFTFYINVLNEGKATPETNAKTLQCVEDYKRLLPDDERAYMAEYETFVKYGELEAAEKALVEAEDKLPMTAQCSLRLSMIYHMRGEYDKAIHSATRAILGQAETQPSSNTGAAFAQRGFSRDAKIHDAILEGADISAYYGDIQAAIQDYETALKFDFVHENIMVRMQILRDLLPEEMHGSTLDQRVKKLERAIGLLLVKLSSTDEEDDETE